jgi:hypothetical protein
MKTAVIVIIIINFAINILVDSNILGYDAVSLGKWLLILQSNTAMGLEPFKMKMTPSFTMSGTTY